MLDRLLEIVAPHHCYECGIPGGVLCDCCKNYMLDKLFLECVVCGGDPEDDNLCLRHRLPYQRLWCVARREGALEKLIDGYKFQRARSSYKVLAKLLDERLPQLPPEVILVPVPTTAHNIRVRGYDHMLLLTRQLARLRQLEISPILRRKNNVTQHFARTATERRRQARDFFEIRRRVDSKLIYLLIDDIFTTGSTIKAAADCLRRAGATEVWAAVIARQ